MNAVGNDSSRRHSVKVDKDLNQPNPNDAESVNSSVSKPFFKNKELVRATSDIHTPSKIVSARNTANSQLMGNLRQLDDGKRPSQGDIGVDAANLAPR